MPDPTWMLGQGIHATVVCRRAVSATESETHRFGGLLGWRAIKIVHAGPSGRSPQTRPHDIVKEARILRPCQHVNVVALLSYAYDPERWEHRLEIPLLGSTIREILDDLSLAETRSKLAPLAGRDILCGLAYLHEKGVAHRDVKPSNILLGFDGHFKLIDLGTAYVDHRRNRGSPSECIDAIELAGDGTGAEDDLTCQVGTGPYRAPELLFTPERYDPMAVDLWAAGCVLAEFFLPQQVDTALRCPDSRGDSPPDSYDLLEDSTPSPPLPVMSKRRTLFDDTFGEIGLAASIFRLLGSPSKESWPGFEDLSDASKIHFEQFDPQDLSQVLDLPDGAGEVLNGLLRLDPAARLPAPAVLSLAWLAPDALSGRLDDLRPHMSLAEERYPGLTSPVRSD